MTLGRFLHLGISVGKAKAVEIESPDIESRPAQNVAPGDPVEPMGHRKRRRKRRPMHIEDGAASRAAWMTRRQIAQEEGEIRSRSGDPEMPLIGIEGGIFRQHEYTSFRRHAGLCNA